MCVQMSQSADVKAGAAGNGPSLQSKWIDRLSPALSASLLVDLIGVIAEYAAAHPLRWSATQHAPDVQLMGPLDEDGCSRRLLVSGVGIDIPVMAAALSDCPIGSFPISRHASDSNARCVRWTMVCRFTAWCWHVFGVARAQTAL
jgi:hypothetical protein